MSDRKLFYLKKFKDFYADYRLVAISTGTTREEIDNGHMKIYLYERLLHLCLDAETEGRLRCSKSVPWTPKLLAKVLNMDPGFVETSLIEFEEYGLIKFAEDNSGTIILPDFPKMVATISAKAKAESDRRAEARRQQNLPPGYEEALRDE